MISVPVVGSEIRPWAQGQRAGSQADRTLSSIAACIPATIATLEVVVPAKVLPELAKAERAIIELDIAYGQGLAALSGMLLRTESIGSSRIEAIEAPADELAQAMHGVSVTSSAVSIVAASRAMKRLLDAADRGVITMDDVLSAHHDLMIDDPKESVFAGRLRTVQNWVGGSDYSPRNADLVPPPADRVADLMEDLVTFMTRTDMPAFVQAAIVHAQFETIHPFTDGNGRIGRALVNALLRLRGVTKHVVVPMASALVANREKYFADLRTYRQGDIEPLVLRFAQASQWAAQEAMTTGNLLVAIQETWHAKLGRTRSNSAHVKLLELLVGQPVVDASHIEHSLKVKANVAYLAIERLQAAGILYPVTDRKRHQIWAARDLMDELMDLDDRIQSRAREE